MPWMGCTTVGACPSHLGLEGTLEWLEDQTEVTKKHREGYLAMVCMQSHQLGVNHCEVTQRTTEDSGCLASRHTSASKLSPNLTHNIGVQLPLVCQ